MIVGKNSHMITRREFVRTYIIIHLKILLTFYNRSDSIIKKAMTILKCFPSFWSLDFKMFPLGLGEPLIPVAGREQKQGRKAREENAVIELWIY